MKVAIISGAPNGWLDIHEIKESFIIGVDRGALSLIEHKVFPHLAIGDFDSVAESELQTIKGKSLECIQLPCEKNETDTEVALNLALQKGATEVSVYGSLGGRMDHSLANIRLLLQFVKKGLAVKLVDQTQQITVLAPGHYDILASHLPYISFFALDSTVMNLTLQRLKYPLINYELTLDDIRCISNEAIESDFSVSFTDGYLLMIFSRD
ncbi:MAG: thiamine diphosphokinase [Turicibacter sp.]|nr:thiamine diphosphokinase [Turicibacter sp.]